MWASSNQPGFSHYNVGEVIYSFFVFTDIVNLSNYYSKKSYFHHAHLFSSSKYHSLNYIAFIFLLRIPIAYVMERARKRDREDFLEGRDIWKGMAP